MVADTRSVEVRTMDDWGGVGDALTGGGGGIADAANSEWVSEDPGAGWEQAPSGGGGEGGGGLGSAWDNATSAVEFGAVSAYHSVAGAFDSLTGDDTGAVVHDSLATAYACVFIPSRQGRSSHARSGQTTTSSWRHSGAILPASRSCR